MGTLYLVATPIGNLEDVTLRALRVLREVDLVLAEDTRRTRVLLERHGIPARAISLHEHNESRRIERALEVLEGDGAVALVSDAGTPLVSDPGARLVAAAIAAEHPVVPVPGASAVLAALVASGIAGEEFHFAGFLPRRGGERAARLRALRDRPEVLVVFESPRRLAATLRELAATLGPRRACVARELSKVHEEFVRGPLDTLADHFAKGTRGEVTIVLEGAAEDAAASSALVDVAIRARGAAGGSPSEVARDVARATGAPRSAVYRRVRALLPPRES